MKAATQHSYQGPHCTGPRLVQIITCDGNGVVVNVESFPARDKADALAIAKRESAVLIE